jgi:filamentous hemagglutinin
LTSGRLIYQGRYEDAAKEAGKEIAYQAAGGLIGRGVGKAVTVVKAAIKEGKTAGESAAAARQALEVIEEGKQATAKEKVTSVSQNVDGAPIDISPTTHGAINNGRVGIDEARVGHIFRDSEGHISDTPANRQLLEDVANDSAAVLGRDKYGTMWAAKLNPDGTQTWVGIRDGKISYGGINQTPRPFNPQTGLASPNKPGK